MHALTMLHNILTGSCSEIHAKRISSLLATVEALVSGNRLTLSDLGRGLRGPVAVKHNIKRVDRLLGIAHCIPRRQGYMKRSPGSIWRV